MGIFVDAQDKYVILPDPLLYFLISMNVSRVLSDMLAPHRKSKGAKAQPRASTEAANDDDSASSPLTVLPSSTDLFYFYGQSFDQCAKLSTGQPLFDLCTMFKKWLRVYAGELKQMSLGLFVIDFVSLEEVLVVNTKRSVG